MYNTYSRPSLPLSPPKFGCKGTLVAMQHTHTCYLFKGMEIGFKIIKTPAERALGYLPRDIACIYMH